MSRKNKTLRAFLHQNENPTIEQAWDHAWKGAQKKFHAKSMQEMQERNREIAGSLENLGDLVNEYRTLTDRIRSAKQLKDWDELNLCIQEILDIDD